ERFRRRPEDDLAGLSGREALESLVEAIEGRLERDQGVEVDDAGLEEPTRLVPGLEDLAPVETEDGEVLEDDVLGDVELDRVRGDAEERHAPARSHDAERVLDSLRRARHLERDVDASAAVL